jgi:hypothetical protein
VRVIGNVKGKHNWFYRLARKAEGGMRDSAYFRLTADDAIKAGIFPSAEVASAREHMPEAAWRELYYAEASDDGSNPFGLDAIAACVIGDATGGREYSVAIAGVPRAGKTTVAQQLAGLGYAVRSTDALVGSHEWSKASEEVATWFGTPGQAIEGVAVGRALRKWLAAHPEGKPCDVVLWCEKPYLALSDGQRTMGKGCLTVWREIEPQLRARGVEIVTSADACLAMAGGAPLLVAGPTGRPVAWGWDFARAQDWTVGIALDRAYRVVRFHRWQHVPWGETKRDVVAHTGDVPAWGDSTGVGDSVVEDIQRAGCPMLAMSFTGSTLTTAGTKQKLMERLAGAIQQRKVRFPDGPIRAELESFEYTYSASGVKYSAPDGLHDDCVMALALAVYGRDQFGELPADVVRRLPGDDDHPGLQWPEGKRGRKRFGGPVDEPVHQWVPDGPLTVAEV